MPDETLKLAQQIAAVFARLPQVAAVALGGSRAGAAAAVDAASDIDLYVYAHAEISIAERRTIVAATGGATRADLGLAYWGPGDEWFHAPTGTEIDIVYFEPAWMEEQLERVIRQAQPALGYTTCLWATVRRSVILFDPRGWLAALQARCAGDYPEDLRRAIIAYNHPALRAIIPAYAHQIEKAVRRGDEVSVNHRLAALFASYFDILFACNRRLHPGEKRLVAFALALCPRLPVDMEKDIRAVFHAAGADLAALPAHVDRLLDRLDQLLAQEGLI